ncbi:hypothetical protein VKT23_019517 [Stygiomarasmius scandens]|uniref:Uncharacterized protein n=1 Tax=Marasmiellus scandens TaxID=2682957 RepID=A0ABR1IL49_9AGAR
MREEGFFERYGEVALLFNGRKADMERALHVRLVELVLKHGYNGRLPNYPQNANTVLMELRLVPAFDYANFGRFYYVIVEAREQQNGTNFVSRRFWVNDIGAWQIHVLKNPEIQCLLSMKNSLTTLGQDRGLPEWVLNLAGAALQHRVNVRLPPGWSHTESPMRDFTPGSTYGEDKKRAIVRPSMGLSKRRTHSTFCKDDQQRTETRGPCFTPPIHGQRRHSPSPPARQYRSELQTWSSNASVGCRDVVARWQNDRMGRVRRSLSPRRAGSSITSQYSQIQGRASVTVIRGRSRSPRPRTGSSTPTLTRARTLRGDDIAPMKQEIIDVLELTDTEDDADPFSYR